MDDNLKMSKKLILIILPGKLRKIDLIRYDIEEYEKKFNHKVEIHDLIDFIHPGFEKSYANNIKNKRLKYFNTFHGWKKYFLKINMKYLKNILIIKGINNHDVNSYNFNFFLKKMNVKTLEFSEQQFPVNIIKKNLPKIFKNLIFSIFFNPRKIIFFIRNKIFIFLAKKNKIFPTYLVKTGNRIIPEEYVKNKVKTVSGNSFDYNMFLKSKNIKKTFKYNYGLFLEAPTPLFIGDTFLDGEKVKARGTPEKWFPSLDKFFSSIEKCKNIKIKIVPHPKVKHKSNRPKYYYGREVINKNLSEVAKNSKIIITRDSAGISFAALHKKPAAFIYTNEFVNQKNSFLDNQEFMASALGLTPINIDQDFDKKKINELFIFNKYLYKSYIKAYLTNRNDKKRNFELIGKLI